MSINWWMDKQNMACPWNRVFSHGKEWSTSLRYNTMNPENNMLHKNKPVTKGHVLYDWLIENVPNKQIYKKKVD